MNAKQMARAVSKESGLPARVVEAVLAAQRNVLRDTLCLREEIVFPKLFRLTPKDTIVSIRLPDGTRKVVGRVMLRIRPLRSFRKELTKWTTPEQEVKSG